MNRQLINEAEKSSSPVTKRLLNEYLKLEDVNKKLTSNLDDEDNERCFKDIEKQEASQKNKIEKLEQNKREHIANRAKENNDLADLWLNTQSLMAEKQKLEESISHYSKEIEKLKTSIKNRNDEKKRIDNIILTYNNYIALIDEKRKKLDSFGTEVVKASELISENNNLSNAINKVEKAIKDIWDLVNKDIFDESLHKR